MSCLCATESFQDYFAEEAEKIQKRILELPEILSDSWSDIQALANADLEAEIMAAIVGPNPVVDGIIDLIESEVSRASPSAIPRLKGAIDELRGVKTTQDALKALAAIIFILSNDSIFHLLKTLAAQITETCALKIILIERIRSQLLLLRDAVESWEAAGLSSSDLVDQVKAASKEVLDAKRQVDRMHSLALGDNPSRSPAVTRANDHITSALEILNPGGYGSALGGAVVSGAIDVASGGMAAALVLGSQVNELRASLSQFATTERKLSGLLKKFKAAVANYSGASFKSYQSTLLQKVSVRLGTVYSEMEALAHEGSTFEMAGKSLEWVASLNTARTMLDKMPPEVRAQEQFDEASIAAYNKAVVRITSMSSNYILSGVDYPASVIGAGDRIAEIISNMMQAAQTTPALQNIDWLALESTADPDSPTAPLLQLDFVTADDADGNSLKWRIESGSLAGREAFPGTTRMCRLDQSLVHALLLDEIMGEFLQVDAPGSPLVTALIAALRVMQQDKAADMLSEAGISEFMDAAPLSWTYAGAAVECLQTAMTDAMDKGLDKAYDQLDTKLAAFQAKVAALQRSMTRKSVFSLDSVLDRLQGQLDDLELLRSQVVSLVAGLDC
jgi:hypothetical protein